MADEDYYATLGVSKTATKEEIKKAYKSLAKKHHPDVSKETGAEDRFKKISEAYAVLSDDTKRSQYDQFGSSGFHQRYSQEDIFRGFNVNDIFADIFEGFGNDNPFEMFFGGGGRGHKRQRRGRDLRYDLAISFTEAAFGVTKKILFEKLDTCATCDGTGAKDGKQDTCATCKGTGQIHITRRTPFGSFSQVSACDDCNGEGTIALHPCRDCNGTGRVSLQKELTIKIPGGVNEGSQLRVSREGEAGYKGAIAGDLYVVLHVQPSDIFERKDNDVFLTIPLTFSQAALGDEISVPTLEKDITLKIPSGTQTGTQFRLKGKGIPYLDGMGRGDQFVIVNVMTPTKLSKDQKKLLEDLKKHEEKKSLLERIKEFAKTKL